jgi:hypothetical protein
MVQTASAVLALHVLASANAASLPFPKLIGTSLGHVSIPAVKLPPSDKHTAGAALRRRAYAETWADSS